MTVLHLKETLYSAPHSYRLDINRRRIFSSASFDQSPQQTIHVTTTEHPKDLYVLECVKTVPKRSLISIKQLNKKIPSVCVMGANIGPSFRPVTFVQLPLWFIAADAPHYHFLVKS